MNPPTISVVMSVYNAGKYLHDSMASILDQSFGDFEFIVVNDGSTDDTSKTLSRYERDDKRVRIIHQENQGLTRALIHGCALARGRYIARQDVGDVSQRDRFQRQVELLDTCHNVALVSSAVRFETTDGDFLYTVKLSQEQLEEGLSTKNYRSLKGPAAHGSVMFRRDQYCDVGGYRPQFYFAQDMDLWLRLIEKGKHAQIDSVLFVVRLDDIGISSCYRKEQLYLADLSLRSKYASPAEVGVLLEMASNIRKKKIGVIKRHVTASLSIYHMGCALMLNGNDKARAFFWRAIKEFPLNVKAWIKLVMLP